jgi:GNAT superfamily N-acetyltransferase
VTILEVTDPNSPLLNQARDLLERTQGRNVCTLDYLKTAAGSPDELFLIGLIGGKLMAAAVAKVLRGEFEYYRPFGDRFLIDWARHEVGSLSILSVAEGRRGEGYGQLMGHARMRWLKSRGCDKVVGVSWMSGLPDQSGRVFEKLGLTQVALVPDFYVKFSVKIDLQCPVCGKPPCHCAAALYEGTL